MCFSTNSLDGFLGTFGIDQLASRIFTSALAEDLSSCRALGETSKGALMDIDLFMIRVVSKGALMDKEPIMVLWRELVGGKSCHDPLSTTRM